MAIYRDISHTDIIPAAACQKGTEMSKRDQMPFYECYLLTVEEAAAYFHIGNRKLYEIISNNEGAKWILYNGKRIMIKKQLFANWIDQQTVI